MTLDAALVDEVRDGLPLPDGSLRDDSLAPPVHRLPHTLYAWPVDDTMSAQGTGDGSMDESTVRVRLEYCAAPAGEEAFSLRDRATSLALDDAAGAVVEYFRNGHRTGATYESALVDRVTLDTVRTLDFRGFAVELRFTRLLAL